MFPFHFTPFQSISNEIGQMYSATGVKELGNVKAMASLFVSFGRFFLFYSNAKQWINHCHGFVNIEIHIIIYVGRLLPQMSIEFKRFVVLSFHIFRSFSLPFSLAFSPIYSANMEEKKEGFSFEFSFHWSIFIACICFEETIPIDLIRFDCGKVKTLNGLNPTIFPMMRSKREQT